MLAVLACLLGPVAATPLATYKVEAWEREDLGASDDSSRLCEARSAKPCVMFFVSQARFPHRVDCFTEGLVLNGSEARRVSDAMWCKGN